MADCALRVEDDPARDAEAVVRLLAVHEDRLVEPAEGEEVVSPDDYQGAVMGDLSSRRGHILGTDKDGRLTKVKALVPEAELDRYATTLHSLTHGRGTYRMKFHVYQDAPPDITAKVTEGRKKELEEAKA